MNENLDPDTKAWLKENKHQLFGFPTLVRFSWGTCTPFFKDCIQVLWWACFTHRNFLIIQSTFMYYMQNPTKHSLLALDSQQIIKPREPQDGII